MKFMTDSGLQRVKGGDFECTVYYLQNCLVIVQINLVIQGFSGSIATFQFADSTACSE